MIVRFFHEDGTLPEDDDYVFVFGSNLAGIHAAGAAKVARQRFGAVQGQGVGRWGQSFAIPTKNAKLITLPLEMIQAHVDHFLVHAIIHEHEMFFVTSIGCGLAGYEPSQIAPLFWPTPGNCDFPDTWEEFLR